MDEVEEKTEVSGLYFSLWNVAGEWLAVLIDIRLFLGSNLGPKAGFLFFLSSSRQISG
jgi:hypothetical protein